MPADDKWHDVIMKDHVESALSANRRHLDRYRQVGPQNYLKGDSETGDDDMKIVSAGNVTINQAAAPPSGIGRLAKLGVAAALVASGVGAGAAIPLAISALTPAAVAPAEPVSTSTTTERDYSIGEVQIEEPQQ